MAYTITITFPVQKVNDVDTIQAILEFTSSGSGSNQSYTAAQKNLRIENYGRLEIAYDFEAALLIPGKYSLTIGDADNYLDDLFFGPVNTSIDKQAKLTIKVNGVNKFIGKVLEDSIGSGTGTPRCSFDAAPRMDIINKKMVYDADGNPINPLGYGSTDYIPIWSILEDIYQLVTPTLAYPTQLNIIHDWQFHGKRSTDDCYLNNIIFDNLYESVHELFFDNTFSISTCGDVLRKIAIDWCAFTGMISEDMAFFKKLFHYNANNVQTVKVLDHRKKYKYGLIDYVKFETDFADPYQPYEEGIFTGLKDRYIERKSLPGFYRTDYGTGEANVSAQITRYNNYVFETGSTIANPPSEGAIYINNSSLFKVIGTIFPGLTTSKIATERVSGTNEPSASGLLAKISGEGDATYSYSSYGNADAIPPTSHYEIGEVRDPNLFSNAFKNHGALSAKFWYNFRGDLQHCRVDGFTFRGIDYDYLKDFNYNGSKYQPISMVFDYANSRTECEAIYLGELA